MWKIWSQRHNLGKTGLMAVTRKGWREEGRRRPRAPRCGGTEGERCEGPCPSVASSSNFLAGPQFRPGLLLLLISSSSWSLPLPSPSPGSIPVVLVSPQNHNKKAKRNSAIWTHVRNASLELSANNLLFLRLYPFHHRPHS